MFPTGEEAEGEDEDGLPGYRDTDMPGSLLGQAAAVPRPDPVVLESLKDLNQLLGGSHMRTVNEWLRILTQVIIDLYSSCRIAECSGTSQSAPWACTIRQPIDDGASKPKWCRQRRNLECEV